jgi:hypothetical protein
MGRPRKQSQSLTKMKSKLGVQKNKFDVYHEYLSGTKDIEELTIEQQEMFDKYSLAWSMANIGRTDDMIEAALQKKYDIKSGMARIIRIESFELFGNVEDVSKKGRLMAAINYFKTLSNLARAEKDFKTATMAWKEASTLEGLYEGEAVGFNLNDFKTAPTIVFTNNINVLNKQNKSIEDDE